MSSGITAHYASSGIAARILDAVRATLAPGEALSVDALAPCDHFHGRGLVATRELVASLAPQAGERLLDIGSGIGGPARWIAEKFACHVTGIDLTPEFCEAAIEITRALGLADRVRIVNGSALALPFADGSFDKAYSQNVIMNVADKAAFYREAFRVLRPGGILALSNGAAGPGGPLIHFPVPWASAPEHSFLSTPQETRREIEAAGFEILALNDITPTVLAANRAMGAKLKSSPLPPLGMHVLMGERIRACLLNAYRSAEEGRTLSIEALARKPA